MTISDNTTKTSANASDDAAVVPLGWIVVWPDGVAYPDPDSDDESAAAVFPTRTEAEDTARWLTAHAADFFGLEDWTATPRRAGDFSIAAASLPPAARTFAAGALADLAQQHYPALPTRTTTEYALCLLPSGRLYRDSEALAARWPFTRYPDRAAAEEAAAELAESAAGFGLRAFTGAAVVARTITTTVSDWH